MQTLTAGSFLNLENDGNIEALKFTARRLAEHTAMVVAENLPPAALANLASNLWVKAEYVSRETERRRLREIFTENFTERFRELKPEIRQAENSISEVSSAALTNGNSDLIENAPAPEIVEESESQCSTAESASLVSPQQAEETEAQEKRDEFLGFVKTDEPFDAASVAETEGAATTTVLGEAEQETVKAADAPFSETLKMENEFAAAREAAADSEGEQVAAKREVTTESANGEKSPLAATVKVSAGNDSQAENANKNGTSKTDTKEPFEFGKCTISLNLVLLPSSAGDGNGRKAIISASSHNQPPEIEFLEIKESENLTEIAEIVRGKLAGFKNGLPAKYIEQLRQSKTKPAKKAAPAKASTNAAATTKYAAGEQSAEETSGAQHAQNSSGNKAEESRIEITATKETAVTKPAAPPTAVPQSPPAANNVQPSLF